MCYVLKVAENIKKIYINFLIFAVIFIHFLLIVKEINITYYN